MKTERKSGKGVFARRGFRGPKRPSHAAVISYLSLFIALGGTGAYAANRIGSSDLARNAVRSKHIKTGQVRSSDVKNHNLKGKDLRKRTLRPVNFSKAALGRLNGERGPRGLRGPRGERGPRGARGVAGPRGAAGPLAATLPSGHTLVGTFTMRGFVDELSHSHNNFAGDSISFGLPLGSAPAADVIQDGEAPTSGCPGSAARPAAKPGNLCVYVAATSEINDEEEGVVVFDPAGGEANTAGTYGASLNVEADENLGQGGYDAIGTWAVTAR